MADQFKIPVYVFTDGDPYGYCNIYRTLKVGSGNAAHINRYFCVPQATLLGGTPEDVTPDMPPYSLRGMHAARDGSCLAFNPVHADGYELVVLDPRCDERPEVRRIGRSKHPMTRCASSADGEV